MHKVQGNYGSCTWGVAKMHPIAVEASGKGEDGVKPGWNSVEHRKWCVLKFDSQLKANVLFWRFFFDLTRFSSKLDSTGAVFPWVYGKHYETPWKLVPACFNTSSKKIQLIHSEVFKKSVSNGRKPTGRSSLCGKTFDSHSENRNEDLEGSHWKSENHPTLVSTCICIWAFPALLWRWLDGFFSPSKFSFVFFHNPTHKTKTGTTNWCVTTDRKPRGPIIVMGQPSR